MAHEFPMTRWNAVQIREVVPDLVDARFLQADRGRLDKMASLRGVLACGVTHDDGVGHRSPVL